MTTASARPRLDAVGITLSALCLLNCLALPLVATGAFAWAASERIHVGLTVALAVIVLAVALPGYQRHRQLVAPLLLVGGLTALIAAVGLGGAIETPLTVLGSVTLVAGHVLNLRIPTAHA